MGRQSIANSLIVRRIELKQRREMLDGIQSKSQDPLTFAQRQTRSHIRPGFRRTPEFANEAGKFFFSQRSFGRQQSLFEKYQRLPAIGDKPRQHRIRVGTIGRQLQRLLRQLELPFRVGSPDRPLDYLLCPFQRRLQAAGRRLLHFSSSNTRHAALGGGLLGSGCLNPLAGNRPFFRHRCPLCHSACP